VSTLLQRWEQTDRRLSARVAARMQPPALRTLVWFLAHSGDSLLWLVLTVAIWWSQRALGLQLVLTLGAAGALTAALKQLFRRRRPDARFEELYRAFDRYTLPSGHAVRVGALTVVLSQHLPVGARVGMGLWSLGVALSRVALGAHFVSDVGIGLSLGWLIGALLLNVRL
jgi:undecaprenyl-diphosphatase